LSIAHGCALRELPTLLREVLERIPEEGNPMANIDILRAGRSFLGTLKPELEFGRQTHVADRLIALLSAMVVYWYRFTTEGVRVETATGEETTDGNILAMMFGRSRDEAQRRCLDTSLILYAEHEFNASRSSVGSAQGPCPICTRRLRPASALCAATCMVEPPRRRSHVWTAFRHLSKTEPTSMACWRGMRMSWGSAMRSTASTTGAIR
jgi:hypothetical protein